MKSLVPPSIPRLVRALAFGTGALVISAALSVPAFATVNTATSVLAAAKSAITQQSSVHLVLTVKPSSTSNTETVVGDLGKKNGIESVSLGKATITLKVNPAFGYVYGNSSGLTTLFGLTSAQAKKLGKDWMTFKAGSTRYSNFEAGLSISSITGVLPTAKGTKLSTDVVKGIKLYELKWTTAATSSTPELSDTLTMSAVGATLPVEAIMSASGGGLETITFSKWGEPVVVSAPPAGSTISYSTITAK